MPKFQSKTLNKLRRLLRTLPTSRLDTFVWSILPLSILSGLVDIAIVALSSRLAGSLVGSELNDLIPGVNVFSNSLEEQAIILVCLFKKAPKLATYL